VLTRKDNIFTLTNYLIVIKVLLIHNRFMFLCFEVSFDLLTCVNRLENGINFLTEVIKNFGVTELGGSFFRCWELDVCLTTQYFPVKACAKSLTHNRILNFASHNVPSLITTLFSLSLEQRTKKSYNVSFGWLQLLTMTDSMPVPFH